MITEEDIADRKAEWGARSAQYVGGVLGEFPEGLDDVLVPLRAATEAAGRAWLRRGRWCSVATWRGSDTTRRWWCGGRGLSRGLCGGFLGPTR